MQRDECTLNNENCRNATCHHSTSAVIRANELRKGITPMRSVEEIKAELAVAMAAEREELEKQQKEVQPIYNYTLLPDMDSYKARELMDPTCKLYTLTGVVLNKKEMHAVQKTPFEGSMTYVYNKLSNRFVIAVGGGSIFLNNNDGWDALSDYIEMNPNGGNVNSIVEKYRHFNKGYQS